MRHQASLQTHLAVAHFAFQFSAGNEGGHGVDDDDVYRPAADEMFGDFQGLFATIGLRDEEVFGVDAQFLGIRAVEGVFGIHKGGQATLFLGFGNAVHGQGGFTGGFGAVNLDHPTAR